MPRIDFSRAIYDPCGNPLDYPGAIIDRPLLIEGGTYREIMPADDYTSFETSDGRSVDALLRGKGEAGLSDRIAQIAFGANRNLENIAWKFRAYHAGDEAVSRDLVAIPGYIDDADVVACNIGYWGYVYAGLLAARRDTALRDYLAGTRCPVVVLLVDDSQMRAMHRSEGVVRPGEPQPGVSCGIADRIVHLAGNVACHAQVYSLSVPFLSFEGTRPVAFSAVATQGRRDYPALDQTAMFGAINARLRAEEPEEGRTPIADTLRARALALLGDGVAATRKMSEDPLYAGVRLALAEHHVLRDADGRVRMGLEDVCAVRTPERAWDFAPLYRPQNV